MPHGQNIRMDSHEGTIRKPRLTRIFGVLYLLLVVGSGSGYFGRLFPMRDLSAAVKTPTQTSSEQPKPLWQTRLKEHETNFIQFLSSDRILIGTTNMAFLWEPMAKTILMLNAADGDTLWVSPRNEFGTPQTLLATNPVILLQGEKQYAALNPENGTLLWKRNRSDESCFLLSGRDLLVLFSQKKSLVLLSALNVKTGSGAWSDTLQNYPEMKESGITVTSVGDTVLLVGPEVDALSASTGKLLWKKPFPGTFGPEAAAIPLGDELYMTDSTSVTRQDPSSGNEIWRRTFEDRNFRNLTASGNKVFVLLKGTGEDSPEQIEVVDRGTGKSLWKYDLLEQAASSMTIEGSCLYVTTTGHVISIDVSRGVPVFKADIPLALQVRKQLPDNFRFTGDRVIVAREIGVMALQKNDGKVVFAVPVPHGDPFIWDFAMKRYRQAVESMASPKKRQDVQVKMDITIGHFAHAQAQAHQRFVNKMTAETLLRGSAMEKAQASRERVLAVSGTGISSQLKYNEQRLQASTDLAVAIIGASEHMGDAIAQALHRSRMLILESQLIQTCETHENALQKGYYIRPCYEPGRGWSLFLVNCETGKRAELMLSTDCEILTKASENLPVFSIDPSGTRILSKGIGLDPAQFVTHKQLSFRAKRPPVPYPSIYAFDLASLRFGPGSGSANLVPTQVAPEKKQLDAWLIEAVYKNDIEATRKLLDAGADVNAVDEYGQTPLMFAAECIRGYDKSDIIKLLLERGAGVDIKDIIGWTAHTHFTLAAMDLTSSDVSSGIKMLEKAQNENEQEQ